MSSPLSKNFNLILCHLEVARPVSIPLPAFDNAGSFKPVNHKIFNGVGGAIIRLFVVRSREDDSLAALVLCISSFNESTDLVKSASHLNSPVRVRVHESLAVH